MQAVGIIEAVLEKFGTYEHFEAATGGQLLTKCQIWSIVRKYMQKEGCVGEVSLACLQGPYSACPKLSCPVGDASPSSIPGQLVTPGKPLSLPLRWELSLSRDGEVWISWPRVQPGCTMALMGLPAHWPEGWWPWLRALLLPAGGSAAE